MSKKKGLIDTVPISKRSGPFMGAPPVSGEKAEPSLRNPKHPIIRFDEEDNQPGGKPFVGLE